MPSLASLFAHFVFGLSWLGWIVMLGGAAGMQAKCGGYGPILNKVKLPDPIGEQFTVVEDGCSSASTTSLPWWGVWFQFFTLLLISLAQCFGRQGLVITKQIFLAMVTVVLMVSANIAHQTFTNWEGALAHSAAAFMAGTVFEIICNCVMMLYFGGEVASMLPQAEKQSSSNYSDKQPIQYNLTAELATQGPSFSSLGPNFSTV